jgi:hypothetical protein
MKQILFAVLMLSFFLFACGKKDTATTDTKKETPKTEQKPATETPSTTSTSDVKLPVDFPLEDEVFKKATVSSVSESMGLKTITFKSEGLPDDVTGVIDKELSKKGFTKSKEDKSDMLTEIEWSKESKKVGVDISSANGKRMMVAVYYEAGK